MHAGNQRSDSFPPRCSGTHQCYKQQLLHSAWHLNGPDDYDSSCPSLLLPVNCQTLLLLPVCLCIGSASRDQGVILSHSLYSRRWPGPAVSHLKCCSFQPNAASNWLQKISFLWPGLHIMLDAQVDRLCEKKWWLLCLFPAILLSGWVKPLLNLGSCFSPP